MTSIRFLAEKSGYVPRILWNIFAAPL